MHVERLDGRPDGGTIRIVRPPGLDALELHVGTAFGHSYPRHWHDGLYIGAITAGAALFHLRGGTHRAVPGRLVVVSPGDVHGHDASGGGRSFRTLHFDAAYAPTLAPELFDRGVSAPFASRVIADAMLARRFVGVHRALEDGGTILRGEAMLLDLLREIAGRRALRLSGDSPSVRENSAIRRARECLDDDRGGPVSLRALAAVAGMSPFHFHRLFRRQTGLPPHEYLIRRRLLRARALLRRGEPPSGVAAETGFADQSHLTRHFKRLLGLPPAAYARARNTARTFKTVRPPADSLRACGNGRVSPRSPSRQASL